MMKCPNWNCNKVFDYSIKKTAHPTEKGIDAVVKILEASSKVTTDVY